MSLNTTLREREEIMAKEEMNAKHQKFVGLLKELFQLDQPDLDFGLYRIMHAKSVEVTQFLDKDLLPQVKAAFSLYKTADKADVEKDLSQVIAGIEAAGMNPEDKTDEKDGQVGIVGYEIPFNRHFYQYVPPRPPEEIDADLDKVSREIMDLLREMYA